MMRIEFTERCPRGCYGAGLDESYMAGEVVSMTQTRALQFIGSRIAQVAPEDAPLPVNENEIAVEEVEAEEKKYTTSDVLGFMGLLLLGICFFMSIVDNVNAKNDAAITEHYNELLAKTRAENEARLMAVILKNEEAKVYAQAR